MLTDDFGHLLNNYNLNLYKAKQLVSLKKDSAVFKCVIDGINEHGKLLVNGAAQEGFEFCEVEWVLKKNKNPRRKNSSRSIHS